MAQNNLYPIYSKRGKVYLRCSTNKLQSHIDYSKIIEKLNITSKKNCDELREEIKKEKQKRKSNRPIKEWIEEERPREMLVKLGAENLPLSKLLAIIIRTGKEGMSAEELAKILLNHFGSLRAIDGASVSDISKISGIGLVKAVQIKSALELGKRLYRESAKTKMRLSTPSDVIHYVSEFYGPYLRDKDKEFFYVILLDIKNKPIDNIEISKGSISSTIVDPKEIIKVAVSKSASSVILVHNHPSGEPLPSQNDISLTNNIVYACNLVGIKVLDHIIIGKNLEDFYSFSKEGLLK
ncbi:MAG: DNA repair protein RadC [Thermodesulfovibrionales bacterium]|nr:DNA repair protein RadC [Thermodesulfovibrionales bacterium]